MRIPGSAKSGRFESRRGLTLIEVLVALTIFLFSIVAIYGLTDIATRDAMDIVRQSRQTRLMESKMADFEAGVESLSGSSGGSFDDEPDWNWSADLEQDAITNLWKVTITVSKNGDDASASTASLTKYILDPTYRGGLTVDIGTAPTGNTPTANNNVTVTGPAASSGSSGLTSPSKAPSSTPSTMTPSSKSGSTPSTTTPSKGGGSTGSSKGG